ncbi:MAG: nucleotidyltransferase domain-containing protein [Firmicutes bacterium]|nr:nucleotidyltransferase domain-containing protein [Bacillota bacterium]
MQATRIRTTLSQITERICSGYLPERIVLYRSYAYGAPDPDSDIDLLIVRDDPGSIMERRLKVRRLLRDIIRNLPVSPVVYTPGEVEARLAQGDGFLREILEKGKVLYERQSRWHGRLSTPLILRHILSDSSRHRTSPRNPV